MRGRATPKRGSSRAVSAIVASSDALRQRARHVGERDVNGRQHDAQRVGVEHHRDVRRAGQVREQIGVAAPRKPGEPERFLVDRRRRDRVDRAALRVVDRAHDRVVRRRPGVARSARPARNVASGGGA